MIRRREFITAPGGAAAAWPLPARAQQPAMPVIGYLSSLTQADSAHFDAAFRRGLSESGFVEGQNVSIEYRWITDRYNPLPAMAVDLVRRQVAMIVALAGFSRSGGLPRRIITAVERTSAAALPALCRSLLTGSGRQHGRSTFD